MVDHTPICTWLIRALPYLQSLVGHASPKSIRGIAAGWMGFERLMGQWIKENAPMTDDQAIELVLSLDDLERSILDTGLNGETGMDTVLSGIKTLKERLWQSKPDLGPMTRPTLPASTLDLTPQVPS